MRVRTLGIGAAIVLGGALFYLDRRAAHTEPDPSRRGQAPASVHSETAPQGTSLQPSLQPSPPAQVVQPNRPRPERTTPVAIEDARSSSPETAIEEFAPAYDALERAFNAESRNGAWALNAQRTAENALAAMLPAQSTISSVHCRETLCRIESTHREEAQIRTFVNQFVDVAHRPWNGAFYAGPVARDPKRGVVTLVTYFAREGATMPAIPDRAGDEAMP